MFPWSGNKQMTIQSKCRTAWKKNFFLNKFWALVCVGLFCWPRAPPATRLLHFSLCTQGTDCFWRAPTATPVRWPWLMFYSLAHTLICLWQWRVVNSVALCTFPGVDTKTPVQTQQSAHGGFKGETFIFSSSRPRSPKPKKRLLFEDRQRVKRHYWKFHGHFLGLLFKIVGT